MIYVLTDPKDLAKYRVKFEEDDRTGALEMNIYKGDKKKAMAFLDRDDYRFLSALIEKYGPKEESDEAE